MPDPATAEMLVERWQHLLNERSLHDLPYKIELNAWGKVEMTPANNRRGRLQGALAAQLGRQLQGVVLISCSILTKTGIRSPDVAWASPDFMQAFGEMTPYVRAPEICVEIVAGAAVDAEIAEKTAAYLAAGAEEVWLVSDDAAVRYLSAAGELPKSRFPVALALPAPIKARR